MPDSVMVIHLGKQRGKATSSPTEVMPIGDTLLHSTAHPAGPGHGTETACSCTLQSEQPPV